MANINKDDDRFFALHYAEDKEQYLNAVVPPVYMNSLHTFEKIEDYYNLPEGAYLYGRYNNPTVEIVEQKMAALEHGKRAFLYSSGMAAATSAVMATCRAGDHVVCVHNAYGPLQSFLNDYCRTDLDISVTFVRGDHTEEIREALQDNTALLILETPGSATFSLVDLKEVAKLAKANGVLTYVDNSYCSPIFQKPLTYGIDLVMHSATKYLGGHSDLIGGVLVATDDDLIERLTQQRPWFGGIIGPMEAWLMMRGLRTVFQICTPLILPGLISVLIFDFVNLWNELFSAVLFIDSDHLKTVTIALNALIQKHDIAWGQMMAGTIISIIPTVLLFALMRKYMIAGLTSGAVKG